MDRTPLRKRKTEGLSSYVLVDKDGTTVAIITRSGTPGRDNYPWDWYLADGWQEPQISGLPQAYRKTSGVTDTMAAAVDHVQSAWVNGYIVPKPATVKPPTQAAPERTFVVVVMELGDVGDDTPDRVAEGVLARLHPEAGYADDGVPYEALTVNVGVLAPGTDPMLVPELHLLVSDVFTRPVVATASEPEAGS